MTPAMQRLERCRRRQTAVANQWTATFAHAKFDQPNVGKILGSRPPMNESEITPKTKVRPKLERPRLHKVILINDDYTPREFVVSVLKAEFRIPEDLAHKVMITAHQRGVCVVAVFAADIAETKATRATDAGRAKGYPLMFTTEPEE
jgi:ATP-dependent Clp protease adaptor protein ClpS